MTRMPLAPASRWLIAAGLSLAASVFAAEPEAGLTCEQIYEVVKEAARYRNQGQTLDQVLRGLKEVETQRALVPVEAGALRKAVSLVYLGEASPEEITLECVKSRKKK